MSDVETVDWGGDSVSGVRDDEVGSVSDDVKDDEVGSVSDDVRDDKVL